MLFFFLNRDGKAVLYRSEDRWNSPLTFSNMNTTTNIHKYQLSEQRKGKIVKFINCAQLLLVHELKMYKFADWST